MKIPLVVDEQNVAAGGGVVAVERALTDHVTVAGKIEIIAVDGEYRLYPLGQPGAGRLRIAAVASRHGCANLRGIGDGDARDENRGIIGARLFHRYRDGIIVVAQAVIAAFQGRPAFFRFQAEGGIGALSQRAIHQRARGHGKHQRRQQGQQEQGPNDIFHD